MSAAPTEPDLAAILAAVQRGDEVDALLDNEGVALALGLSLEVVAESLQAAKDQKFIWGMRSGRRPAPWYTDLELTVQGQRFLADHPSAGAVGPH